MKLIAESCNPLRGIVVEDEEGNVYIRLWNRVGPVGHNWYKGSNTERPILTAVSQEVADELEAQGATLAGDLVKIVAKDMKEYADAQTKH